MDPLKDWAAGAKGPEGAQVGPAKDDKPAKAPETSAGGSKGGAAPSGASPASAPAAVPGGPAATSAAPKQTASHTQPLPPPPAHPLQKTDKAQQPGAQAQTGRHPPSPAAAQTTASAGGAGGPVSGSGTKGSGAQLASASAGSKAGGPADKSKVCSAACVIESARAKPVFC